jgi:ATP-binding cassette subfamily B protein
VVEGGWIVEQGRHADLLRKGGRYSQLYRIQFREAGDKRTVA